MKALVVAAAVVAVALGAGAARAATETFSVFFWDYAAPGAYATTGYDGCEPTSGSADNFGGYGWATVALIDTSGNWRRSARSSTSPVAVYVDPDTLAQAASWHKKALCKNSGAFEQILFMRCLRWYYSGTCV